jgi:hypothetical protein
MRTDIGLGDMIETLGDPAVAGGNNQTLNSPVTEIKISWPKGTPDSTPAPTMSFTTFAGELEPVPFGPVAGEKVEQATPERSPVWEATKQYVLGNHPR